MGVPDYILSLCSPTGSRHETQNFESVDSNSTIGTIFLLINNLYNFDIKAYNLIKHLRAGKTHMEMAYNSEEKFNIFVEMRYNLLRVHWPHETFSVEQGTYEFFQNTLDYLEGRLEIPRKETNSYQANYFNWIKEWKNKL